MHARIQRPRRIPSGHGSQSFNQKQTHMSSSSLSFGRRLLLLLGLAALPAILDASPGEVYTLNNATDVNRVLVYARDAHGVLTPAGNYPTGGRGTGANLNSQGALAMSANGRWLVAVNAGSNEVSVFSVRNDGLVLTDVAPSGGQRPTSVTVADNLVYVLNTGGNLGGADNISGFFLTERGQLLAVPGSTRALSAAATNPAQVSFGLRGDVLLVTERATHRITGFTVNAAGLAGPATPVPSSGNVPYGFAVSSKGFVFVSEAAGSALSSYRIHANGSVGVVTASLANHQGAACWTVLSKDEKFAYTANAAGNSISGYRIGHDGSLSLLDTDGHTAAANRPLDLAMSNNGRFLYALNAGSQMITGYLVAEEGGLTGITSAGGLPIGSAGLIAR
jgi:6-phosphogluconolactonase